MHDADEIGNAVAGACGIVPGLCANAVTFVAGKLGVAAYWDAIATEDGEAENA
jgi:hypothetical protein